MLRIPSSLQNPVFSLLTSCPSQKPGSPLAPFSSKLCHILKLDSLRAETRAEVCIHADDAEMLKDPELNGA